MNTNKSYLSSPNRTRQEEASSLLQYLQPLAIRHGKSIVSASTCKDHICTDPLNYIKNKQTPKATKSC